MSSLLKLLNPKNFFADKQEPKPHLALEAIIEQNPTTVTKQDINGVPSAFLLRGVLTEEECNHFIQVSEQLGFTFSGGAGDSQYASMPDMRHPEDNKRAAANASHPILHHLWKRVKDLVPPVIEHDRKRWKVREDEKALNELFRFLRYDPQQRFWAHFDGGFKRGPNEQTHYTFIMYLNDDFEGGETIIYPEGKTGIHGRPLMKEVKIRPERGMALVFRHSGPDHPLHSGAPHSTIGKKKYVLRTDIMYILEEERND